MGITGAAGNCGFGVKDTAELATPIGMHGSMKQVDIAGDPIFGIVIGVVVQTGPAYRG